MRLDLAPPSGTMRLQDQAPRDKDDRLARCIPNHRLTVGISCRDPAIICGQPMIPGYRICLPYAAKSRGTSRTLAADRQS